MKNWKLTALSWDNMEIDSVKISAENKSEAVRIAKNIMLQQGLRTKYKVTLNK